jgi:glutamate-ammonia ligase adenylyltransferase
MPSVTLEETVRELSALADASLDAACRFCRAEVEKDYGLLNLPGSDKPNRFVILGMGKLGGGELNFSSDIDVIFLYESDDGESISWEKTSDPTHSHANHLLKLEIEHRAAARHSLWHERLQVFGQDARVEQTVAHEVNKIGKFFVGELNRRL